MRCGAILCVDKGKNGKIWKNEKIRQLPRTISGKFVMLHWCVLGPFAEEPLGLQLHPAVPARSIPIPTEAFTILHFTSCSKTVHCNLVFPNVSICFHQAITQKIQDKSGLPVPPQQHPMLLLPAPELTWLYMTWQIVAMAGKPTLILWISLGVTSS